MFNILIEYSLILLWSGYGFQLSARTIGSSYGIKNSARTIGSSYNIKSSLALSSTGEPTNIPLLSVINTPVSTSISLSISRDLRFSQSSTQPPMVVSSSTLSPTSQCVMTSFGERTCEHFPEGDPHLFCGDIIRSRNNSLISRHCAHPVNVLNSKLDEMFTSFIRDERCAELLKWFMCSFMFPPCDDNTHIKTLPCREVCQSIKETSCKDEWQIIERSREFIFKHIHFPSCDSYPSVEHQQNCSLIKFAGDLQKAKTRRHYISYPLIGGLIGALTALVALLTAFLMCYRKRHRTQYAKSVTMSEIRRLHSSLKKASDRFGSLGEISPSYTSLEMLVNALGIKIYSNQSLTFDKELGEGAFGKVVRCTTENTGNSEDESKMVAVKYLKADASSEMEEYFRKEVEILSNFQHKNVIPLLGVNLDNGGHKCLILEYMKYGDLNEYLQIRSGSFHALAGCSGNLPDGVEFHSPELSFYNLLLITRQIADGLSYMSSKRFVHRDIATRNVLVGDDLLVKISDFGLAQDIYGTDYYRVDSQKMLPLRWLSPEALTLGKFTIHSDIWSFGITMWEIFTYGMQPFYGYSNEEVCQRIRCLKVPERPYCCPPKIYEIMKACWKFEPTQRRSCLQIKQTISEWLDNRDQFIEESWKRLLMPPLADRIPTIKRAKMKYLNTRIEIAL